MVKNAENMGTLVTTYHDQRITRLGTILRKYRIDEFPQLINVLKGDMTFVGARPEVVKYVKHYTSEMYATLLLPAGITSAASIIFKDENVLLSDAGEYIDEIYIKKILPKKMKYNLEYIEKFSICNDLKILFQTLIEIAK